MEFAVQFLINKQNSPIQQGRNTGGPNSQAEMLIYLCSSGEFAPDNAVSVSEEILLAPGLKEDWWSPQKHLSLFSSYRGSVTDR